MTRRDVYGADDELRIYSPLPRRRRTLASTLLAPEGSQPNADGCHLIGGKYERAGIASVSGRRSRDHFEREWAAASMATLGGLTFTASASLTLIAAARHGARASPIVTAKFLAAEEP